MLLDEAYKIIDSFKDRSNLMPLSRVVNNIQAYISKTKISKPKPSVSPTRLPHMLSESSKLGHSALRRSGSQRLDSQIEDDDKSQSEYLSEDYFFVPANDIDADSIAIRIINEDRLSQCQFANPESIASKSNAHPSLKMYATAQGGDG